MHSNSIPAALLWQHHMNHGVMYFRDLEPGGWAFGPTPFRLHKKMSPVAMFSRDHHRNWQQRQNLVYSFKSYSWSVCARKSCRLIGWERRRLNHLIDGPPQTSEVRSVAAVRCFEWPLLSQDDRPACVLRIPHRERLFRHSFLCPAYIIEPVYRCFRRSQTSLSVPAAYSRWFT